MKTYLYIVKHHAMKMYWGSYGILCTFLTLALGGGEGSASRPGHFIPGVRSPSTCWVKGWVGLSTNLDAVAKRKIPIIALLGIEPQSSNP